MPVLLKPSECSGCILFEKDEYGFSLPEGEGTIPLGIFGEALGAAERRDGLPFRPYAQAGSLLEQAFKRTGHPRKEFILYNVVNCQPPRNFLAGAPWETEAIQRCQVHRDNFMESFKPKALLALGGIACRTLTGLRGTKQGITLVRGYVVPSDSYVDDNGVPIPVLSTFHPAFIRRGQSKYKGVLYHDLLKAIDIAQNGWEPEPPEARYYATSPSQEEAEALAVRIENNPSLRVCYDVETPYSADKMEDEMESEDIEHRLESIQFSVEPGTGYYFPWVEPFIGIAKRILRTQNEKLSFNGYLFDDPILLSAGCEINGTRHDLMCAWHHLQPDIDANLQFAASFYDFPFPWKHLAGDEPRIYGCCDVDAPQRMALKIFKDMDKRGVRRGYEEHIVKLRRILYKAECRGIPVNNEKRVVFGTEIREEERKAFERLQSLIPQELKKTHPSSGYKREPKGVSGAVGRYLLWRNSVTIQPKEVPELIKYVRERSTIPEVPSSAGKDGVNRTGEWDLREFSTKKEEEWRFKEEEKEWRWCIIKPFLPSSHAQLKDYMRYKKHPIPKDFKTRKETTEASELEKMAKKFNDPVYEGVITVRQLHKMLATYVEGWVPKKDGRVHTSFTFRPATGQLSSRAPNAQNVPKHANLGKRFREIIEAPPGYTLVAADFRAFHALTTGYEAGDLAYMRMARLDIHAFLASHLVGKPISPGLPDKEIVPLLRAVKEEHEFVRNKQAKPCILGYGFGLQVNHFYEMNKEVMIDDKPVVVFKNVGAARMVTQMLDRLFAAACRWRKEIPKLAHRQSYLVTSHGYVRYFHEVFKWDSKRQMLVPGDDHEKAIAFKPANNAFGHIKDVMLRLEVRGLNDRYGFINNIHDELMFCCPNGLVSECVEEVHKEMEKPSTILVDPLLAPEGLWCGAEVSIGKNWNDMEEVKGASISK